MSFRSLQLRQMLSNCSQQSLPNEIYRISTLYIALDCTAPKVRNKKPRKTWSTHIKTWVFKLLIYKYIFSEVEIIIMEERNRSLTLTKSRYRGILIIVKDFCFVLGESICVEIQFFFPYLSVEIFFQRLVHRCIVPFPFNIFFYLHVSLFHFGHE